jgi:hypothetical protein
MNINICKINEITNKYLDKYQKEIYDLIKNIKDDDVLIVMNSYNTFNYKSLYLNKSKLKEFKSRMLGKECVIYRKCA